MPHPLKMEERFSLVSKALAKTHIYFLLLVSLNPLATPLLLIL